MIRFTPLLLAAFAKNKKKMPVGDRWRMDETYITVKGEDRYLYRAVDKNGDTVDFLLTAHRDRASARRFLEKATKTQEVPSLVNIDKSAANKAGIEDFNDDHRSGIRKGQLSKLKSQTRQSPAEQFY